MQRIPSFVLPGTRSSTSSIETVVDKIDERPEANENEERTRKLTEDKELLVERNKHIQWGTGQSKRVK